MSVFALQYARALADVVLKDKLETAEVDRQLNDFLETFRESKELRETFSNPSIELEEKLKVLDAIASRIGMMRQTRNFLAVLVQNDRMASVGSILAEYHDEMNLRLHISRAEITSVRELTPEEKSSVEAKAAGLTGLKIRPVYRQDPSLLGGLVLRIGDTVYDGSVRGRLAALREKLLAE
jgi:F-type H+-transporting ATPase subunit delta